MKEVIIKVGIEGRIDLGFDNDRERILQSRGITGTKTWSQVSIGLFGMVC